MTQRVVPLMYLLDDRGGVGHGTAGRSSTIEGILRSLAEWLRVELQQKFVSSNFAGS
jgi:hypothetical protein